MDQNDSLAPLREKLRERGAFDVRAEELSAEDAARFLTLQAGDTVTLATGEQATILHPAGYADFFYRFAAAEPRSTVTVERTNHE